MSPGAPSCTSHVCPVPCGRRDATLPRRPLPAAAHTRCCLSTTCAGGGLRRRRPGARGSLPAAPPEPGCVGPTLPGRGAHFAQTLRGGPCGGGSALAQSALPEHLFSNRLYYPEVFRLAMPVASREGRRLVPVPLRSQAAVSPSGGTRRLPAPAGPLPRRPGFAAPPSPVTGAALAGHVLTHAGGRGARGACVRAQVRECRG